MQSITAAWLIKIVGLTITKYFENNQDWGDGGIQDVVGNIYEINKREEFINKFIREAITKLKRKNDNQNQKKLTPYFKKD